MTPKKRFGKKLGSEGKEREKKEDKDGTKGMRARKTQGSLFNEPKIHPSFTFKSIV